MSIGSTIALVVLSISAVLVAVSIVRSSEIASRVIALDLLLLIVVGGVAVSAGVTEEGVFLDVLVVASLLGFTGTLVFARHLDDRHVPLVGASDVAPELTPTSAERASDDPDGDAAPDRTVDDAEGRDR